MDVLTQDTDGNSPESIKDAISKILFESKATKYIGIETEDRGAAVTLLAEKLAGGVETVVFAEIKEIAVRDAIEGRGFSVQPGGNWAWGGSTEVTGQTVALGKELGVSSVSIHAESAHGLFEEQVEKQVLSAREGKRPNGKFDWKRYPGKYHALLPQITPKSRRVLYDSGLLTSRV